MRSLQYEARFLRLYRFLVNGVTTFYQYVSDIYTVSQKTASVIFWMTPRNMSLSDFIRFCYFWQKHTAGNLKRTRPNHISFYMFVLYLVKLAMHQNAHCDVGRFRSCCIWTGMSQLL